MTRVFGYHDGTKHHFDRFARSLGYLDWSSQPAPFRSFSGARELPLAPRPDAPPSTAALGALLRCSLGLSAWKRFRDSRWALRVNPSSGNLHPTEAYVLAAAADAGDEHDGRSPAGVYHYAPDRHALERRCAAGLDLPAGAFVLALTSIHWRESWKYGERGFRYCQHDLGHAIAAVRLAAALNGWTAVLLPGWSHRDIAALTGVDRDDDFVDAEREEPACVFAVGPAPDRFAEPSAVLAAVRRGVWSGRASRLSEDHVQWTFIDDVAEATRDEGRTVVPGTIAFDRAAAALPAADALRAAVLQRRSAVAFDGRSSMPAARFKAMLARVLPSAAPPWDALWWEPCVHLALFVHRVDGLEPGLYVLIRNAAARERLLHSLTREFLWEQVDQDLPLFALARGDCRRLSQRLSCDQAIASDGFFSLGMIAEFASPLERFGPAFYRHLFWECGVVGQILYLEAELAGARGTGIGCFYDDPVHEVLGIRDHSFQSLYHFTIGMPVEDTRLTTERGYGWELES